MALVTITDLEITSHCSPSQIEGTLSNGFTFYARSRYSSFSIALTPPGTTAELLSMSGSFSVDPYNWLPVEQLLKFVELYVASIIWERLTAWFD